MTSESKLVVELWDYFRDMLAVGKRQEAAIHLLRLFQEYGVEIDHDDLEGECEYLDDAVAALMEDDHHDHDSDWDREHD